MRSSRDNTLVLGKTYGERWHKETALSELGKCGEGGWGQDTLVGGAQNSIHPYLIAGMSLSVSEVLTDSLHRDLGMGGKGDTYGEGG